MPATAATSTRPRGCGNPGQKACFQDIPFRKAFARCAMGGFDTGRRTRDATARARAEAVRRSRCLRAIRGMDVAGEFCAALGPMNEGCELVVAVGNVSSGDHRLA